MKFKERLFHIIELTDGNDKASTVCDYTMMAAIIVSLIPLAFKNTSLVLNVIDWVKVSLLIID